MSFYPHFRGQGAGWLSSFSFFFRFCKVGVKMASSSGKNYGRYKYAQQRFLNDLLSMLFKILANSNQWFRLLRLLNDFHCDFTFMI